MILDVCLDNRERSSAAAGGKIRRRPQTCSKASFEPGLRLLSKHSARHALEAVDELRNGNIGRIVHQQVHVIPLSVHFQLDYKPDQDDSQTSITNNALKEHIVASGALTEGDQDEN